jgi:outer membrane protein OmpA-like peptidoglycan-associated protein
MFALWVSSLLFTSNVVYGSDVKGSHDHPVVSRFAGSSIIAFQEDAFDAIQLPAGAISGSQFSKTFEASGKVTRIAYIAPEGKTSAEIMANYAAALDKAGFTSGFSCTAGRAAGSCGGMNFSQAYTAPLLAKNPPNRNQLLSTLYAVNDDARYLGAELRRADSVIDVGVMAVKNGSKPAGILVTVVEKSSMPTGQVTVDADAMSKGLAAEGKIALYGLTFDTDSAKLTPSSDATLKQMSELLHKQPSLKVYIVGHTDDTGALAHNLTLSQQRAESVVKALSTTYGIAANRLGAKGVASYAPVASNHSDAGKAKNRRVELVEQ